MWKPLTTASNSGQVKDSRGAHVGASRPSRESRAWSFRFQPWESMTSPTSYSSSLRTIREGRKGTLVGIGSL